MDQLVVEGGIPLVGSIEVSGSKNAALPILAATLLLEGESRIYGVPNLRDVNTLIRLVKVVGCQVERNADGSLSCAVVDPEACEAPYEIVRQMRAGVCLLGPMLARRGRAKISLPGGCNLGVRPIDLHLKGLRGLGAEIRIEGGYIHASGRLRGEELFLAGAYGSTVLGTANVLMAACLAEGRTVIEAAACEPEIADLANFLVACGAQIEGICSPRLVIEGVERLQATDCRIIPDRMEAGTFLAAGVATGGDVTIDGVSPSHMGAVVESFRRMDATVERRAGSEGGDWQCALRVKAPERPAAAEITTLPYPGFPTDLHPPLAATLALADGMSLITERVYPERFVYLAELNRMGADVRKQGDCAIIHGVPALSGAPVMASDIRGGAALVVAALAARGTSTVDRVYHIDRGYERIEEKLCALGARVKRVSE